MGFCHSFRGGYLSPAPALRAGFALGHWPCTVPLHLGSALLRPDQGRRTESARLKTSGSSAAARVPDQAALCAGAMHARQSRCARLRPPMLVLHVSAACALAVRTRCCACPCCAFPCCAPSCWACGVLVQRSSRSCALRSSKSSTSRGCTGPCFVLALYMLSFCALALPMLALCAPAVRALAMRARAVCLRVVCGVLVQRSPTSCGAR